MKRSLVVFASILAAGLCVVSTAAAATPTLTLSGSGDTAQLTVQGDANTSVLFYYNVGGPGGSAYLSLGSTNGNGTFTGSVTASSYGLNTNYQVYVMVGTQQSVAQSWPGVGTTQNTTQTTGSGTTTFDTSSVSIVPGQTTTVTIYGGGTGYYVSGASNPNVVATTVNGTQLTISALQNGSTVLTVCSSANVCGTLSTTVGQANGSQAVVFSPGTASLAVGQTLAVNVGGTGANYFATAYPLPALAQVAFNTNTNTITLTGVGPGTGTMNVCSTSGGCNTLNITVSGVAATPAATTTQTPAPIVMPSPTPGSTTPTNAQLFAIIQSMQAQLTQLLTQIQTMATSLNQLAATVSGGVSTPATAPSASVSTSPYTFTQLLDAGSQGPEVSALQQKLTTLGFYSGPISGYYGALTQAAVKKYQASIGVDAEGYVGPATMNALNAH